MSRPKILIVEKDEAMRMDLVCTATRSGYQVQTTLSVVRLLDGLLRRAFSVVLVGDSLEGIIQIASLVSLMKASHPQVVIILISDDISLQQMRKIREEGIFYHALKPVDSADWQELTMAMVCAYRRCIRLPPAPRRSAMPILPRIH